MRVQRIGFVGTRTNEAEAMRRFLRDVLGLTDIETDGIGASFHESISGDVFAVVEHDEPGRTVGLVVDDVAAAAAELGAAGIETDGVAENRRWRYVHFTAPDGQLYELVEDLRRTT
jgi:glyoxylase I family protein